MQYIIVSYLYKLNDERVLFILSSTFSLHKLSIALTENMHAASNITQPQRKTLTTQVFCFLCLRCYLDIFLIVRLGPDRENLASAASGCITYRYQASRGGLWRNVNTAQRAFQVNACLAQLGEKVITLH